MEGRSGPVKGPNVIFISFVPSEGEDGVTIAIVIGRGQITRGDDEGLEAFRRRAYASFVSERLIEDASDEELETIIAAHSEELAQEKVTTGTLSDESITRAFDWS